MRENYPTANQAGQPGLLGKDPRPPSIRERLEDEKERCELRLEQINMTLEALNANPAVDQVLELVSKFGF